MTKPAWDYLSSSMSTADTLRPGIQDLRKQLAGETPVRACVAAAAHAGVGRCGRPAVAGRRAELGMRGHAVLGRRHAIALLWRRMVCRRRRKRLRQCDSERHTGTGTLRCMQQRQVRMAARKKEGEARDGRCQNAETPAGRPACHSRSAGGRTRSL